MRVERLLFTAAIVLAFVILAFVIFLSGYEPTITSGEVYDKEFRPAHIEIQYMPTLVYSGKTVTTVLVPYVFYYDDRYVVYIKAFDGEAWQTEDFYVPKETWDALEIGDTYGYDESRGDLADEPYTKKELED